MRSGQKLIQFLNWFGAGFLTPILSLMLLERGCTLQTLSMAMGVYSAAVVLCEVPTGVFADLFGRKKTFLLSCGIYVAAFLMVLIAGSHWMLVPAMAVYGIGRAFASGSLDALIVEDAIARLGDERLSEATGQLSLYQGLGLTVGALAGSALPSWQGYTIHLLIRIASLAAVAVLSAIFIEEGRTGGEKERPSLRGHLSECSALLRGENTLWGLLCCLFTTGFLVSAVETYWQPAFTDMTAKTLQPMLGVLSALGFGAVIVGNLLVRHMADRFGIGEWKLYLSLRVLCALAAFVFALRLGVPGFFVGYLSIYLVMGGTDVLEQTLMNRLVADRQRASFLSVASLTLQLGGVAACAIAAVAIGTMGFGGVFALGGAVLLAGTTAARLLMRRSGWKAASQQKTP